MSQLPTLIFSYRVEDILDEVTKRTSYLGKMRSTDQEPYVIDRLSLTKGEGFMFSEFLEDAVTQTYDWLRAFGRSIPMYDKIVLKYEDIKITKDDNPDGTSSASPTEIKIGTYVEYHNNPSNIDDYEVYQVNATCTTDDWMDYACKLAVDPRGCIVFILERSCNMDMNLISSIDRNIKEAIVDYIIYKWFEYTNVSEAESFYDKFEKHAREAKKGMDSEKNIMQRKYNINR